MGVCMGSEAVPPGLLVLGGYSEELMETASFMYMLNQRPWAVTLCTEFLGLCPLLLPNGFSLEGQLPS